MGLTLKQVVPWGRSLNDYIRMFNLTEEDLNGSILDCGGGPSSFNAEATQAGTRVVSCDPLYQFSVEEINGRILDTYPLILEALDANLGKFVWRDITTPEHLGQLRLANMKQFLADFPTGKEQGRYLVESLPALPFRDRTFDLALCAHLLFSYSEQFDLDFHINAIREMCRVAKQARVFPLLTNFAGDISPHLHATIERLGELGYGVCIEDVKYEFQKGGNQMLCVFPPDSEIEEDSGILG
ncbi:MAG: SAM-dependent methyltransferase [Cyanobacteria bacterium SID2]|nr:SAM-dependent methyltransferase [Cyanobacteria bacterium SID2]MBP0002318.1 SAM-dependent methyltransferase [Cyanobacteria bacterium SBC]